MKKWLFLSILGAFFIGCGSKEYHHEPLQNELLAYTYKFEHVGKSTDRYLAILTYLNPILRDENKEIFTLSSYPKGNEILVSSVAINSDKNVTFEEISADDELLKLANINLPWSKHFKLTSDIKDSDYLTISYQTKSGVKVSIKVLKVSKSMYWNPQIKL